MQPAVPRMRPIFVGGCERSGTTLLGAMLGAHPACLCIPEMPFKLNILRQWDWDGDRPEARLVSRWLSRNWRFRIWGLDLGQEQWPADRPGYRQTVEFLVAAYGRRVGKPGPQVWVDHTPANVRAACTLFQHFPDARMVHIVRDGRAVANSIMRLEWGPNEVESAAHFWTESLAWGLAAETVRHYLPALDWGYLREQAEAFHLTGPLYCALSFAHELLDAPIPADFLASLEPQKPWTGPCWRACCDAACSAPGVPWSARWWRLARSTACPTWP